VIADIGERLCGRARPPVRAASVVGVNITGSSNETSFFAGFAAPVSVSGAPRPGFAA
jgi:hypothetical protein